MAGCSGFQHARAGARMAVGAAAADRACSSQAAAAGRVAAGHLGVPRSEAAASAGMEREMASRVESCGSPLRQERSASRKELCAKLSASSEADICRLSNVLISTAEGLMNAPSLRASCG